MIGPVEIELDERRDDRHRNGEQEQKQATTVDIERPA